MKRLPWRVLDPCCYGKRAFQTILFLMSVTSLYAIDCTRSVAEVAGDNSGGIIQSPGFPNSYPKLGMRYTCTYSLQIIGGGYIKLSFEDFHLDDEVVLTCKNNGTYDYLTIDLHNSQSSLYHCGIGRPAAFIAPRNMVTVELIVHPSSSNDAVFRGFRMKYEFITGTTKEELSSTMHDESTLIPSYENDEGIFTIPQVRPLVSPYKSQSLHVIWYVTAPTESHRIQLSIIEFSTPSYVAAPMVLVADGPTSQSRALLSGNTVNDGPLFSTQRFMFVQLDGMVTAGVSFKANFSFFSDLVDNEACPPKLQQCRHTQQCILPELFCNGRVNCRNGEDEAGCNSVSDNSVPDLENTSIMIGAFVGAVCLLSICWLVAMARKRYTEQEDQLPPGTRPPQRMISVHSPEELGLSRSITSQPGDIEIPPDYSEVFMDDDKPASTIIPIGEPLSPPPCYDLVTDDDDGGIILDLTNHQDTNLPDIVENGSGEPAEGSHEPAERPPEPETAEESISRQSSRSTDV